MKILVIDDDPAMTDLLKLLLRPAAQTIIAANSGLEGIRIIKELIPDIIILDMMMPEMSGVEVCHKVREFTKIPILILSALDSPGMVVSALEAGADDYLIKPTTIGMLLAHINKLMRRIPVVPVINVNA
jgi:DNA-binding response OmpR family regulator